MSQIPQDDSFDSTLALLHNPYRFISKRCRHYHTDLFETRIMFQKMTCMYGKDAAKLFYDKNRFKRSGAPPGRIQKTLFGRGGVQSLDNEEHAKRKQMFMSLMAPEHIKKLNETADTYWRRYRNKWTAMNTVNLYTELQELLCQSVCEWAGVPLRQEHIKKRTYELTALYEKAGSIGPQHWYARIARKRANRWIKNIIEDIRAGRLKLPEQSAAFVIAVYQKLDGKKLSLHDAAVELLNILRPAAAVSVFITFAAMALHHYPACRQKLKSGNPAYLHSFVHEVRRFYPFFPAVIALARHDFEWKGYHFPAGRKVILDLYGTNHDRRIWKDPEVFEPDRFQQWGENPFAFIPQGGGDYYKNHRCPGEGITIELMKVALNYLTEHISYKVQKQNLEVNYTKMPALPHSGFIISNVH